MILYHGSSTIIEKPIYGAGNIHNDYGRAFYCTKMLDMAKEWAVTENMDGYANRYEIDMTGLKILDLHCGEYHLLNWLAILLENRLFRLSEVAAEAREYILDNFSVNYKSSDVIKGYRADDSYFSFANTFLNNGLPLEKLGNVMRLGDLGHQYAIRSEKAFKRLSYKGFDIADKFEYYSRRKHRDDSARQIYRESYRGIKNGTFIIDIMREEWGRDDERLRHFICI